MKLVMKHRIYPICKITLLFMILTSILPTIAHALAFESTEEARAFKTGNLKKVKRLIEQDEYFKDAKPITVVEALYFAIDSGNLDLIKYLASRGWLGICRKEPLCAPIYKASYYKLSRSKPIIEFFISQEFNPIEANTYGATSLHAAVKYSADIDLVRYLCEIGVEESARDHYYKRTALEMAVNELNSGYSASPEELARRRVKYQKIVAYLESGQCRKNH